MPYITSDRVKEIRKEIKNKFRDFKFSITREHSSVVSIKILEAPIQMLNRPDEGYESVNTFYIHDNYRHNPEALQVLKKIYEIANEGNGVLVEDSDYGIVPNFYVRIYIGAWDKPFILK